MDNEAIRDRVRQALQDEKLSMRAAAIRAGLGETFLRDFLNGRYRAIRVDNLQALAGVLNRSVEWLIEGTGPPTPESKDPQSAEIFNILPRLSARARKQVLDYARFVAQQKSEAGKEE